MRPLACFWRNLVTLSSYLTLPYLVVGWLISGADCSWRSLQYGCNSHGLTRHVNNMWWAWLLCHSQLPITGHDNTVNHSLATPTTDSTMSTSSHSVNHCNHHHYHQYKKMTLYTPGQLTKIVIFNIYEMQNIGNHIKAITNTLCYL